jgi:hypothetical protein
LFSQSAFNRPTVPLFLDGGVFYMGVSKFRMCCGVGDKILTRIIDPPKPLCRLLTSPEPKAVQFRTKIRQYNAAFAFTSLGVKIDDRLTGNGFCPFQINGEIYHHIGTLDPDAGNQPVYAQHYPYDGHTTLICHHSFKPIER